MYSCHGESEVGDGAGGHGDGALRVQELQRQEGLVGADGKVSGCHLIQRHLAPGVLVGLNAE